MIDQKLTKEVSAVIPSVFQTSENVTISGKSLRFSLCVRDNADTVSVDPGNRGNYFSSFNLPTNDNQFTTGSTISLLYPELYQLITDRFIMIKIPSTAYTEFIDARSIDLKFWITNGVDYEVVSAYSSTYTSDKPLKEGESSPLLGDNIAYLFSDRYNRPYSGLTYSEIGLVYTKSGQTSWNPTGLFEDRPSATSYLEVQGNINCLNTDRRYSINYSNAVPPAYPGSIGDYAPFYNTINSAGNPSFSVISSQGFNIGDPITVIFTSTSISYLTGVVSAVTANSIKINQPYDVSYAGQIGTIYKGATGAYYNYDIPIGFVILDKGIIVLTHKGLINEFAYTNSSDDGFFPDGTIVGGFFDLPLHDIYFTGSTHHELSFTTIKNNFRISTVCMALNNEFYISNNSTWNRDIANSAYGSMTPVQITEVGLYNAFGELIGVSKFSEPIQKSANDILTFNIHFDM